ncbi:hypothetical protein B7P43_G10652 [Cryptotermes secundus]|uniref:G-protein coupled receptors family 2 profile 2 domain-containing protein n=1 Tax=Cryptotermes secundus TaxID=105785 RepID=A0A2J7QBE5_9NEOP|nr:hypothetical protein B7P43_G10652 [Cryptotermes secundus]
MYWQAFGAPCSCDPLCAHYKDCCQNSEHFAAEDQVWGSSPQSCFNVSERDPYFSMKKSCPASWDDDETRSKCQGHPDFPLTSSQTLVTYSNMYCAECNRDFHPDTDTLWPAEYRCHGDGAFGYEVRVDSGENGTTDVNINVENPPKEHNKHTRVHPGDYRCDRFFSVFNRSIMRICPQVISTCASDWIDTDVEGKCLAYTDVYCNKKFFYRNPYCAQCNRVNLSENFSCDVTLGVGLKHEIDFTYLLRWDETEYDMTNPENDTSVPEVDQGDCRPILLRALNSSRLYLTMLMRTGSSYVTTGHCCFDADRQELTRRIIISQVGCNLVTALGPFTPQNLTPSQLLFHTHLILNTQRRAARPVKRGKEDKEDVIMEYITLVGLSVSVACLVLHLAISSGTPRLRNLPAMNLASLCVALLLFYCSFLVTRVVDDLPCVELAVVRYYSLLANYCWLLVISFDVWNAIRRSTKKLQLSSGTKWKRFAVYSAFGWVGPILIITFFFSLDNFSPSHHLRGCWFSEGRHVLGFVVAPLGIVMTLNVAFFTWTAYLIYSTNYVVCVRDPEHTSRPVYLRVFLLHGESLDGTDQEGNRVITGYNIIYCRVSTLKLLC